MAEMVPHGFTIDLEDWHQMLSRRITGQCVDATSATVTATEHLLDVLDETGVSATFFVVGLFAERFPRLVQTIHSRGHEIGSHSFGHRPIFTMSSDEFRNDTRTSMRQLEDLTGGAVHGFRAPEFSVGYLGHWCFDILTELGFRYDSSVFPIGGARYGIPNAPEEPFRMQTKNGPLWEFPLATWRWHGFRLPVAGGTYYRLLPASLLRRAVAELDARGSSAVFYFHPYEFSSGVLRLNAISRRNQLNPAYLKYRFLHNFRTPRILRILKPILMELEFRPLAETCSALSAGEIG